MKSLSIFKSFCALCIGIFIGAMIADGINIAGIILVIVYVLVYISICWMYKPSKKDVTIHVLSVDDPKPEGMPDEVWEKVHALMQEAQNYTDCNEEDDTNDL